MFNNLRSWANCFPQQPHRFTFPPAWHKDSYFSTSLSALIIFSSYIGVGVCVCVCVCEIIVTLGGKWYLSVVLICISLKMSHTENLFMYLLAIYRSPLKEWLLKSFCSFCHCCLLFCPWVIEVFYICVYAQSLISNSLWSWTVDCQAPLSMGFSRQEIKKCDLCSYSLGRHKGLRT